jgi:hypothetical protein
MCLVSSHTHSTHTHSNPPIHWTSCLRAVSTCMPSGAARCAGAPPTLPTLRTSCLPRTHTIEEADPATPPPPDTHSRRTTSAWMLLLLPSTTPCVPPHRHLRRNAEVKQVASLISGPAASTVIVKGEARREEEEPFYGLGSRWPDLSFELWVGKAGSLVVGHSGEGGREGGRVGRNGWREGGTLAEQSMFVLLMALLLC